MPIVFIRTKTTAGILALLSVFVSFTDYSLGLLGLVCISVSYGLCNFRKEGWSLIFGIFALAVFLFAKWVLDVLHFRPLANEFTWLNIIVAGENILFTILLWSGKKNYLARLVTGIIKTNENNQGKI